MAGPVDGVDVRTAIEEAAHDLGPAVARRAQQGPLAQVIRRLGIGPAIEQQVHDLEVAEIGGDLEHRAVICIFHGIDVVPFIEPGADERAVKP